MLTEQSERFQETLAVTDERKYNFISSYRGLGMTGLIYLYLKRELPNILKYEESRMYTAV